MIMDITTEVIFLKKSNESLREQQVDLKKKQISILADHRKELSKFRLTLNKKENQMTEIYRNIKKRSRMY